MKHKQLTQKRWRNVVRLIFLFLGVLTAVFGFWVGASTAGFNFWTTILGYGILTFVFTYAFAEPLQNMAAFLLIAACDKVEEDWYVRVTSPGSGIQEGRIHSIHIMWVELVMEDDEGNIILERQIPTKDVVAGVVERDLGKELELARRAKVRSRSELKTR